MFNVYPQNKKKKDEFLPLPYTFDNVGNVYCFKERYCDKPKHETESVSFSLFLRTDNKDIKQNLFFRLLIYQNDYIFTRL